MTLLNDEQLERRDIATELLAHFHAQHISDSWEDNSAQIFLTCLHGAINDWLDDNFKDDIDVILEAVENVAVHYQDFKPYFVEVASAFKGGVEKTFPTMSDKGKKILVVTLRLMKHVKGYDKNTYKTVALVARYFGKMSKERVTYYEAIGLSQIEDVMLNLSLKQKPNLPFINKLKI